MLYRKFDDAVRGWTGPVDETAPFREALRALGWSCDEALSLAVGLEALAIGLKRIAGNVS